MSEPDLLMAAFKQGYNEAKEQARERITELERREKHLEEMFHGWRDEARKADARIAELEAALKDLREAAYDVDEMDMPFSQRNEWGCCLAKADEALKGAK